MRNNILDLILEDQSVDGRYTFSNITVITIGDALHHVVITTDLQTALSVHDTTDDIHPT